MLQNKNSRLCKKNWKLLLSWKRRLSLMKQMVHNCAIEGISR
ncbi:hypothetical protein F383_29701 [Gossypium arboreum]|uniref:Uncharacterized protein n=1 Tax=Gossypium arboreum TaxID=29729 RepID=A0A0B0MVS7_GOSAR|nr:hypothetical protein F383_29701 [Gossypium arboreum]